MAGANPWDLTISSVWDPGISWLNHDMPLAQVRSLDGGLDWPALPGGHIVRPVHGPGAAGWKGSMGPGHVGRSVHTVCKTPWEAEQEEEKWAGLQAKGSLASLPFRKRNSWESKN